MRFTNKKVAGAALVTAVLGGALFLWHQGRTTDQSRLVESLSLFGNMPANTWVQVATGNDGGWTRQGHAGAAYDSKTGTLLVFGSDTHGQDWDNTVHEFIPALRAWRTLGTVAGRESYAADPGGHPVAGSHGRQPWAMHTYDGLEYDPRLDALIVAAATDHNPVRVEGVKHQRTWMFERTSGQWRPLADESEAQPPLFGAALAYDEWRDTLMLCKNGMWELGPERSAWRKVAATGRCDLHHALLFDPDHGQLLVFGGYQPSADIWAYTPNVTPGAEGAWRQLGATDCPRLSASPVAYDRQARRFVLVAQPNSAGAEDGYQTYAYDADAGRCKRVAAGAITPGKMNFMMVWHAGFKVTLLVTGDWKRPTQVWALRLAAP